MFLDSKQQEKERGGTTQRKKDVLSPNGCLTIFGIAWLVWIFIDLIRLDVFSGKMRLVGAVKQMPSIGIPLVLLVCIAVVVLFVGRISRRKKLFPAEPWMWDRNWDRIGARASLPKSAIDIILLALGMTQGTACLLLLKFVESKFPLWVSAPFVVATIGVWIWFTRIWMPIIRFGRPFFRYRSFPFYLGTALEGTLEGLDRINGFDQITITLRCFIERYRKWRRSQVIDEDIISKQVQFLTASQVVEQLPVNNPINHQIRTRFRKILPIRFELPDSAQGTRMLESPVRKWELQVKIQHSGKSYDATFLLPVYNRPAGQSPSTSTARITEVKL